MNHPGVLALILVAATAAVVYLMIKDRLRGDR